MLAESGRGLRDDLKERLGDADNVSDKSHIGYLIRPEDREEIESFISQFPALVSEYIPVCIIGEGRACLWCFALSVLGTFSTVYKAIDVKHYQKDNASWIASSRQDPFDVARLLALFTALHKAIPTRARKKVINSRLNQCIKEFVAGHYLPGYASDEIDAQLLKQNLEAKPPVFVAIKRINATSGPRRIAEEMKFLRDLQGLHHVVPIVTASRWEDQVIVVSPFFYGVDFRVCEIDGLG